MKQREQKPFRRQANHRDRAPQPRPDFPMDPVFLDARFSFGRRERKGPRVTRMVRVVP